MSNIYNELKSKGVFNIADYPASDLVTLKGLRTLLDTDLNGLEEKDRVRLLKSGDQDAIYLWLCDNSVYRLCRLTEKNAALLEDKLSRTRSNHLEVTLRRLNYEN